MLIKTKKNKSTIWGVWRVDESIEELMSMITNKQELVDFQNENRSKNRFIERLAVRVLLKNLMGEELPIKYLASGKPYIQNKDLNISISHTKGYVAVVVSFDLIGIDIEYISNRVERVKSMFIGTDEFIDTSQSVIHLLLHWSAKESMYKCINLEGIDFKKQLIIQKFTPAQSGYFSAIEKFTQQTRKFVIQYLIDKNYVLTLAYPH